MVAQHGQGAERHGGSMLAEDRGRIRGEARRFADVVAAEEEEIGACRAEERQRAIDIVCARMTGPMCVSVTNPMRNGRDSLIRAGTGRWRRSSRGAYGAVCRAR